MTTLPVRPVTLPTDLTGQRNGQLDAGLLEQVPGGSLHHAAAGSWMAMRKAALADGITLTPTSTVDTYRPLFVQVRIFEARYDRTPRNTDTKVWQGVRYWLKPGNAMAAVPGTSNHGWGLAVDVVLDPDGKRLRWLLSHALAFGWSWEAQSEPWHIRYCKGDDPAVPAYRGPYKVGDRGPAVKAIQRALGITADGVFGPVTGRAVRRYRQRHPRLWPASAVVNQVTYKHLTGV